LAALAIKPEAMSTQANTTAAATRRMTDAPLKLHIVQFDWDVLIKILTNFRRAVAMKHGDSGK
jgi:hypothetical protein